jgi:Na+-transporting NADH:ubiquinone oxidoreductase subunit NqrF
MPRKNNKHTLVKQGYDPYCFVCGAYLSNSAHRYEMHHYPKRKHLGGERIVPMCIICHDMIDRVPLDTWDSSWIASANGTFLKELTTACQRNDYVPSRNGWLGFSFAFILEIIETNWGEMKREEKAFSLKLLWMADELENKQK